jgi:RNA polymerase sigma-70 factor (sigma-E family)
MGLQALPALSPDPVAPEAPGRVGSGVRSHGGFERPVTDIPGSWNERDESVARLFDEHYRGLCRLAGLLLGDSAGAEEVVQEAFLRTFSGWWRVRHPERAQWYLRTSVVNISRSRLRRRTTEDRGNRVTWSGSQGREDRDEAAVADDSLMLTELVRKLPPRQRDAVVLRYYEDLSEAEIARVLGCAVGTVKSQLSKARATLARAISESSGETPGELGGEFGA